MLGAKRQRLQTSWSRNNIVICHCPILPNKHVHCSCDRCKNSASYVAKTVANSAAYANKCNKGVLVGGMGSSSEKRFTANQIQLIKESQDCFAEVEVMEHGYEFRSLFMTTSRRFKCVPQILGSLSIHIFTLLFLLITYS